MIITLFEKFYTAYTHPEFTSAGEFVDVVDAVFRNRIEDADKSNVMMFNFWEFKTQDYEYGYTGQAHTKHFIYEDGVPSIRRCKANALALTALHLDIDAKNKWSIDNYVAEKLVPINVPYFIYSSHSYKAGEQYEKFRVLIPLVTPMPLAEVEARRHSMIEFFGCDNASFSSSQAFYLPSMPPGGDHREVECFEGQPLDWQLFEAEQAPVFVPMQTVEGLPYDPQDVLSAVLSCKDIGYDTIKYGAVMLRNIMKTYGLSKADFDNVCVRCARADSSLKKPHVRNMLWGQLHSERCWPKTFVEANGGTWNVMTKHQKANESLSPAQRMANQLLKKYGEKK